jgi:hypothetical protein
MFSFFGPRLCVESESGGNLELLWRTMSPMNWYQSMGHKGPVLRPRCIGPGRARNQILFYFPPKSVACQIFFNSGLCDELYSLIFSVKCKRGCSNNFQRYRYILLWLATPLVGQDAMRVASLRTFRRRFDLYSAFRSWVSARKRGHPAFRLKDRRTGKSALGFCGLKVFTGAHMSSRTSVRCGEGVELQRGSAVQMKQT